MSGAVPRAGDGVRPAADSYRPQGYGMSAALHRARRPFRARNAIIGTIVAVFAIGVYTYSIRAVKQEDFSDIDILVPAAEQRSVAKSIEDEEKEKTELKRLGSTAVANALGGSGVNVTTRDSPVVNAGRSAILQPAASSTPDSVAPATMAPAASLSTVAARGFASRILPEALHPTDKTLIWGAPNVDKVGMIGDRRPIPGEKRLV